MKHLFAALLLALGGCDTGEAPLALYFVNVGDSDRPLPSFVLAGVRPRDDELASWIGEPSWRVVDVFELSPAQLAEALAEVESRGVAPDTVQPRDMGYGAYRVTATTATGHTTRHLDPVRAAQVFERVAATASTSEPRLGAFLDELRARTQPRDE